MKFDEAAILEHYRATGPCNKKGWYNGDCPLCGKPDHFGINFGSYAGSYSCFKCQEKGTLHALLKQFNLLAWVDDEGSFATLLTRAKLVNPFAARPKVVGPAPADLLARVKDLPFGFERVNDHPYLRGRGFTDHDFFKFKVGVTTRYKRLDGFLIFPVYEGGQCRGYVARSLLTKEELEAQNALIKAHNKAVLAAGEGQLHRQKLRYDVSPDSDFDKLLLGFDELTDDTETVFLVEGLFGKANVDRVFHLDTDIETKCLVTFGKKVTDYQLWKLRQRGVRRIVFMYDVDALRDMKELSQMMLTYFESVECCWHNSPKDTGDMNPAELTAYLHGRLPATKFFYDKILPKIK
jgi:DNA primase